ncbi:MAG TPA: redoxin domain-containing protein [Solirubrobacteraceae bacterium]|nr:redoxin domain-containing protein [Solirubrobacteraceae bacterium]
MVATIALAVAGCGGSHGSGTTAAVASFDGATYPAGVRAPDFVLPDLSGQTVSLSSQRGRVVALVFLPGDCRTCVLVAQQLRGALDELGRSANVRAILISTAPDGDSRARARAFLTKTALLGRASYLLASEARLRPVWRAYHVTPPRIAGQAAAEDAITVLLIDPRGLQRVGFGIEQITPEALSHDIRLLSDGET